MFLQTCNVVASEKMVADTCEPSVIVIDNIIKQLETNVSLILPEAICCLQTCNVVGSEVIVGDTYVYDQVLLSSTLPHYN